MNALAIFLTPDPGEDGRVSTVEAMKHVTGRLILVASIGFCVFTVAFELLGPAFAAMGGNWFFNTLLYFVGVAFGLGVGFAAPFMEAFGFHLASLERKIGPRIALWLGTLVCILVTIGAQLYLGGQLISADRAALEAAEGADNLAFEQAQSMRDTSDVDTALAEARTELEAATQRRDEASSLKRELAELPEGVYAARTAAIQTIIGAAPDGIKYDQTVDAMRVYADAADAEYTAAQARRDDLRAERNAIRDQVRSGAVAQTELGATNAAGVKSITKGFRELARQTYKWNGDPRMDEPAAVNNRAGYIADGAILVLVLLMNFFNLTLNGTGHGSSQRREPTEPIKLHAPEPEPIGPVDGVLGEFDLVGQFGGQETDEVAARIAQLKERQERLDQRVGASKATIQKQKQLREIEEAERELAKREYAADRMAEYLAAGYTGQEAARRAHADAERGDRRPVQRLMQSENTARDAAARADADVRRRAGTEVIYRGSGSGFVRDGGIDSTSDSYREGLDELERLQKLQQQ